MGYHTAAVMFKSNEAKHRKGNGRWESRYRPLYALGKAGRMQDCPDPRSREGPDLEERSKVKEPVERSGVYRWCVENVCLDGNKAIEKQECPGALVAEMEASPEPG